MKAKVKTSKYTLSLNHEEMEFLAVLMGNISGHPEKSARGIAMRFADVLHKVGFDYDQYGEGKICKSVSETLHFRDYTR